MSPDSVRAKDLVDRQAEDEWLWFAAQTAAEAYLQEALRNLHRAVESEQPLQQEIAVLKQALRDAAAGMLAARKERV